MMATSSSRPKNRQIRSGLKIHTGDFWPGCRRGTPEPHSTGVGKAKGYGKCISGRMMDAAEGGNRSGLAVTRTGRAEQRWTEGMKLADRIASMSPPVALMVKGIGQPCLWSTLAEGLAFRAPWAVHAASPPRTKKEGRRLSFEQASTRLQGSLNGSTAKEKGLWALGFGLSRAWKRRPRGQGL